MALSAGTCLGPYEVVKPLGAGGMGEVYRARDSRLKRDVAVKVLPASFSSDPERLRRFEQEAQAAGSLNHPNITANYDVGTHDGAPYVVSELLEGETLRAHLAGGSLSPRQAIDCALQIAQGLAAAHEKGIVHRDLKPENLFVTTDGRVKILDFGLAKLTHTDRPGERTDFPTETAGTEPGVVLGTLGYMSPEQGGGSPRTIGPTSSPLAGSSTKCSRASARFAAARPPTWLDSGRCPAALGRREQPLHHARRGSRRDLPRGREDGAPRTLENDHSRGSCRRPKPEADRFVGGGQVPRLRVQPSPVGPLHRRGTEVTDRKS
jgi:serine/threonine protein kinase